jgi:hypothetical protein
MSNEESTPKPYKFGYFPRPDAEMPFEYSDVWCRGKTNGPDRLVIAASKSQIDRMVELCGLMPEPYFVLYVLVVPRSDSSPGRYQSPDPLSRADLSVFANRFREYFECDGRHDLWIGAPDNSFLLVYDRHNVIYAYGPLDVFEKRLRLRGMKEVADVVFPSPHAHEYNSKFDADEASILEYMSWKFSPLQEGDEL